ncbi:MAG: gliding motility-associated C-terminal domain-containing protein [Crocinitomicaceae bacterium]
MFRFLLVVWMFPFLGMGSAYAENQTNTSKLLLPPPVWSCIQTVGSDVVLKWEAVTDPGGNFVSYEVHSLEDGLLATINNIATTTYTDIGVSSIKHYFISVIDNVTGATNSSTLQNIRLSLANPANGTAILTWNVSGFPLPAAPARPVEIQREYPTAAWTIRDSVTSTTTLYRDTIDICEDFLNYQIVHPGNGCDFTSNVIGDVFKDKTTPNMPVITNVTIDTVTGDVTINWNVNQQNDTYGYVVYLMDPAGFLIEIDTVWGQLNTSYTYTENTSTGPLTYSIAAFDHCFTSSVPPTHQTSAKAAVHKTVYLSGVYDECGSVAALNWTAYFGWPVDHYDFYYTDHTAPWVTIPNLTSLQQLVVLPNTAIYSFVVKAYSADGKTSYSNLINLQATANAAPTINYILSASVINQQVNLKHLVDTAGNVSAIAFEWLQKDGIFQEVGRVNVVEPVNYFIHPDANVEQLNYYRAVVIDSCGNKTIISDTVTTTVLTVLTDSINYINTLNWSPYIGFDGPLLYYDIYRSIDGVLDPIPLNTIGPATFTFEDVLGEEIVRHTLCYFVVANEGVNSYGYAETANSNVICGEYTPTVFIPNAFTPNGFNPIFRPEYSYMKLPDFYMKIIDRWGQVIHETSDPVLGWNGTLLNGSQQAPNDVYTYWIRFYGIDDKQMIFTGQFSLLR